jgi:hypothetical protein
MRVLVGCESSGRVRDAFAALGHDAWSCDLLPCKAGGKHLQCDVLTVLNQNWDLGIFHPMCTYLTGSAEWAFADPDFDRWPGVGYHQKVKPGTLTGQARRDARQQAIEFVDRIRESRVPRKCFENPVGALSSRWRQPDQIVQPYEFGDDASKKTCLWLENLPKLKPTSRVQGRFVTDPRSGKLVERWSNQTDGGQNRIPPSNDRWSIRSVTYAGIANAMAEQWGTL